MVIQPELYGFCDPVYPCREVSTRHCPAVYEAECGDRPCARFESKDPSPWIPEVVIND